jgi:hypothetical protein
MTTYSREKDQITLRLTMEQWQTLLLVLGYSTGAAIKHGEQGMARLALQLANQLNEGNPEFMPYEVP